MSLRKPSGIGFKEISNKLLKNDLNEYLINYQPNIGRVSICEDESKISWATRKTPRFICVKTSKQREYLFRPNLQYFGENVGKLTSINKMLCNHIPYETDENKYYDLTQSNYLKTMLNPLEWEKVMIRLRDILMDRHIITNDEHHLLYNKRLGNANISGQISKLITAAISEVFDDIIVPISDNLPDIIINNNIKCEIKVAKTCNGDVKWRSGNYSKRDGSYFLISWKWNREKTNIEFFVCYTFLNKETWMENSSETYYGPYMAIDDVFKKYGGHVILGDVFKSKQNYYRMKLVSLPTKNDDSEII
jgi:hypothetical protein